MSDLAHTSTSYEVVESEPPEQFARNLVSAGYLLASATAFFFLAFVFAYFYLRALNNNGMWRPKGVDPSVTLGTLIMVCFVACAVLVRLGLADQRSDRRPAWRVKGAAALGLGVLGVVLQVVEWATQGFGPTGGGYASVYVGWTGTYLVFALGALFWLETVLAMSFRFRHAQAASDPAGDGDSGGGGGDGRDPATLVRDELVGLSFFWTFFAGIGVLTWIVLYLV